jgi:multiple sugar transport system substrate-binding protein
MDRGFRSQVDGCGKSGLLVMAGIMLLHLAACTGIGIGSGENNDGQHNGGQYIEVQHNSGQHIEGQHDTDNELFADVHETEDVNLRIAWWGSASRSEYTLEVIELYTEQHPHVSVEVEYARWNDYWQTLAPQAAAGQLPDIIQMDMSYIAEYSSRRQLPDMHPFIEDGTIRTDIIAEDRLAGGEIDGRLFGFNMGMNALGITIDYDMLAEVGIDHLPADWTWEDMIAVSGQVHEELGHFGMGRVTPDVFFAYYLLTHGERLYSDDGASLGYEDDQYFIDFFGMFQQLASEGIVPTPDMTLASGLEEDFIVQGTAPMAWGWTNTLGIYVDVADQPFGIHPLPGPNQDQGHVVKPSMLWSIAESSKHKEEAAKFIDFWTHDEEANKLINAERGIPLSVSVQEMLSETMSEAERKALEHINWVAENGVPFAADPVGASVVIDLLEEIYAALLFGQISPEEAARQFHGSAATSTRSNWKKRGGLSGPKAYSMSAPGHVQ